MEKKIICHVTDVHDRYDDRVFLKECRSIAQAGHTVYLVVSDQLPDETIDGVHIISSGYKASNRIGRFMKGPKSVLKKALELNADLYQLHDPELLTISGKLKNTGAHVIFDSHEDVSMQLLDAHYIPKPFRKLVSAIYCKYASKKVGKLDGVISVSPHIVEKLSKWNNNALLVTNYPVLLPVPACDSKKNDKPYVFFAGGVTEQWMHEQIIQAVNKVEDIDYIFAGPSSDQYIDRLSKVDGWHKTKYLGVITREEVDEWYSQCLAGMTINYSSQAKGIGTLGNNKLFETMRAQKPVICTDYILWKQVVEKNKCGLCVDPFDVDAISDAIRYIINNTDRALEMGKNGRKAVENEYNWENQKNGLLKFYDEIFTR